MKSILALAVLFTLPAFAARPFQFTYAGRTYTVTTQALQSVFTFNDTSHWLYEPSVVLPSPQTNNQYVLIFSSGTGFRQQAIYTTISPVPTSFPTPPTKVLDITATSNLCDMIDARPFWDGSLWHVYVQAIETCPLGATPANMYEATGPSLQQLSWVFDTGTHARQIFTGSGAVGIGEILQWFNTSSYQGPPSLPFSATFNNWGYCGQDCRADANGNPNNGCTNPNGSYVCTDYCPSCGFNGTDMFNYLGSNGTSPLYFWYYRQSPAVYINNSWPVFYPDTILGGSLDEATAGNPGIGFADYPDSDGAHQDGVAMGFYPDPIPNNRTPSGGVYILGVLESTTMSGSTARMHSPRIARNPYGYLDPVPGSSPRTWQTYLYYNDQNLKGGRFAVSQLTITQQ